MPFHLTHGWGRSVKTRPVPLSAVRRTCPRPRSTCTMHAPGAGRANRGCRPEHQPVRGPAAEPSYDTTPAGAFDTNQRSAPFDTPDSSGLDVVAGGDPEWTGYDSARNNMVHPDWPQVGSFTKFGEHYPANGDLDGDGDTGADTDHDGM